MAELYGKLTAVAGLNGAITLGAGEYPFYDGAYTFTPAEEPQRIRVANRVAINDIIVEPIPTTYGRLVWDGTEISIY